MMGRRKCRVCGCTDDAACWTADGPCYWAEDDLCSACVGIGKTKSEKQKAKGR